ncbi:MAG: acyl carrier protein [Acidobacteriales bacterium]|nr:acyl carrier protein [Terriglobales bacterium]
MVQREVIAAIAAAKKIPPERISLESSFEELGVDSLDSLTIMFALEERFDISIPDEAVREMRAVREVVEGLQHILLGRTGASQGTIRRT